MTTALNMTKEYRSELKKLRTRARALARIASSIVRDAEREFKRTTKEADKALDGITKESASIEKRRLILAGRISK